MFLLIDLFESNTSQEKTTEFLKLSFMKLQNLKTVLSDASSVNMVNFDYQVNHRPSSK